MEDYSGTGLRLDWLTLQSAIVTAARVPKIVARVTTAHSMIVNLGLRSFPTFVNKMSLRKMNRKILRSDMLREKLEN